MSVSVLPSQGPSIADCTSRARGRDGQHANLTAYLAWTRADSSRHTQFLQAVETYIRLHNENPDSIRLVGVEQLRNCSKVVTQKQKGVRVSKPKMQFVELSVYKE
eukprot:2817665-Alexandrium_andersonii.AAC.1